MSALEHAIAEYPHRIAETTERVTAAAAATVTGQDEGGLVTVTASGQGEILAVRVTYRALRDLDSRSLAARVVQAVNDALDNAEAVLVEANGPVDDQAGTEDRLRVFEQRMDGMLDRLDRLGRDLDRILD